MTAFQLAHAGEEAEKDLERLLTGLGKLGAKTVRCSAIDVSQLPSIGFDEIDLDTVEDAVPVKGTWYYQPLDASEKMTDALLEAQKDIEDPIGFFLVAIRDGIAYQWTLTSKDYADFTTRVGEDVDEERDDDEETNREEQGKAEALLREGDEPFISHYAKEILQSLPADALRVNVHQTVTSWFTARHIYGFSFKDRNLGTRLNGVIPRVIENVKMGVDERRRKRLQEIAKRFGAWYESKGRPRFSKALIAIFANEAGVALNDEGLGELKALIEMERSLPA